MISFIIPEAHLSRHFAGGETTGSVFYAETPAQLLTYAVSTFPDVFKESSNSNDKKRTLSFKAEEDIGLCNVVAIEELTQEEKKAITLENRDGISVKTVVTARTFPTKEFHIILGANNTVITMFPGPLAPPLPKNGEHSEFWDRHVFVKPL